MILVKGTGEEIWTGGPWVELDYLLVDNWTLNLQALTFKHRQIPGQYPGPHTPFENKKKEPNRF